MINSQIGITIAKEQDPNFVARGKKSKIWLYKLTEPYIYRTSLLLNPFCGEWLVIKDNEQGTSDIIIPEDYVWDGCTPKYYIIGDIFYVGTPEGVIDQKSWKPKTYYASLVHDALCQYIRYNKVSQADIDNIFLEILKRDGFYLANLYYLAVRLFSFFK